MINSGNSFYPHDVKRLNDDECDEFKRNAKKHTFIGMDYSDSGESFTAVTEAYLKSDGSLLITSVEIKK